MLRFTGQSLHSGIKESLVCRESCGESTDEWDGEEPTEKEAALVSLRRIQSTFRKARHSCLQVNILISADVNFISFIFAIFYSDYLHVQ